MNNIQINDLYDLEKTIAKDVFGGAVYPWEVLSKIKEYIIKLGETLSLEEYNHPQEDIWISKSAKVFPSAYIGGPCIIDHEAEIRHCAFIRGSAIVGKKCVVGNSVELKNVILFDNVQVPHYNYVGDSILGYKAHMGAGSITSNVKSDKTLVTIKSSEEEIETGIKKVGAFLGDNVEVGCNSVLCPGTIIGRNTNIYPLSRVRGVVPSNHIYKNENEIVVKKGQSFLT
ncbi:MAG: UDP-N-acetylglucosamine pyrophosphorylase [Clostridia bacterium]|nr:UDP-N-acetylglucosamine pyrophosphorylase [Clostridia bacterium]